MSDPVAVVYPAGVAVSKDAITAWESARSPMITTAAEARGLTLAGRTHLLVSGSIWLYDALDTSSAHDGTSVIVSAEGRRYKNQGAIAQMTGAQLLTMLAPGSVATDRIAPGGEGSLLSTTAGVPTWVTATQLAAAIDGALGSTDWRGGPASMTLASIVSHLPANASRGGVGGRGRIVQMADGSIRAGGAGTSYYNGRPDGTHIGILARVGFPPSTRIAAGKLFVGAHAAWVIDTDGWPWSWGDGSQGALGHGDTVSRAVPKRIEWFVATGFKVGEIIPVMSGDYSNCHGVFYLEDGGQRRLVYCGSHAYGAAGDGTAAGGSKTSPVFAGGAATPLTGITYVTASGAPTTVLVRKNDGSWRGWGANSQSCLGITGSNFTTPQSLTAMQGWSKALCGGVVTIAMTSAGGGVRVAGQNTYGELGIGSTTAASGWQTPIGLTSGVEDIAIAERTANTLAAIQSGTVLFWGINDQGQVGDGTTTVRKSPFAPEGAWQGTAVRVAVVGSNGYGSATIVQAAGALWGCGYNGAYNLSVGISGNITTHAQVLGVVGEILDWSVTGFSWAWGLTVLTTRACLSGGSNDAYDACIGPWAANQGILGDLMTQAAMGAQGPVGETGATGPAGLPTAPSADVAIAASTALVIGTHGGKNIKVTPSAMDLTMTLPATGMAGDSFIVTKIGAGAGKVIVATDGGTALAWLSAPGDWVSCVWYSGGWNPVAWNIQPLKQVLRSTVSAQPLPPLMRCAHITVRSGGGGGSGGKSGPSGTIRIGGAGGGAGPVRRVSLSRSMFGPNWTAVVGAGGPGGAADTSGGPGGYSEFRTGKVRILAAVSANQGFAAGYGGNSLAAANAGLSPLSLGDTTSYGGSPSTTGSLASSTALGRGAGGGGAAGGGVTIGNTPATGQSSPYNDVSANSLGGAAGVGVDGGDGMNAIDNSYVNNIYAESELTAGGGGGGGSDTGVGGAGGNGYDGGGGGGGGGGITGGAGGAGGDGVDTITWNF